jgi:hypothetical protein
MMPGRSTLSITHRLVHMDRMVEVQNRMLATL